MPRFASRPLNARRVLTRGRGPSWPACLRLSPAGRSRARVPGPVGSASSATSCRQARARGTHAPSSRRRRPGRCPPEVAGLPGSRGLVFERRLVPALQDHRTAPLDELRDLPFQVHPADRVEGRLREVDRVTLEDQQPLSIGQPGAARCPSAPSEGPGVSGRQVHQADLDFQNSLRRPLVEHGDRLSVGRERGEQRGPGRQQVAPPTDDPRRSSGRSRGAPTRPTSYQRP